MTSHTLSKQINQIGIWAVVAMLASGVIAAFLPLEAPQPTQEDAARWLMTIGPSYLLGWINQIVAMIAMSVVFAAAAWQIFPLAPIRAYTVWIFTLLATNIFFITKFLSVWAVPLMAKKIASGAAESAAATTLLDALGAATAFGFIPALDYLGFSLYGLGALFIFRPLFRLSLSCKVAAVGFFFYGVALHLLFAAALIDILPQAQVGSGVLGVASIVVISSIALVFRFKHQTGRAHAGGAANG